MLRGKVCLPSRLSRVRVPSPAFSLNRLSQAALQADRKHRTARGLTRGGFFCGLNACSDILPRKQANILPRVLRHPVSGIATSCHRKEETSCLIETGTSCLALCVRDPGRKRVLERKEEAFDGPKHPSFFSFVCFQCSSFCAISHKGINGYQCSRKRSAHQN